MTYSRIACRAIDKLFNEMMPYDLPVYWRKIWAIERRFNVVGYGDMLEHREKQRKAQQAVESARRAYDRHQDSDNLAMLRYAQQDLAYLTR